ncbi:MAG TPA: mechanosensitive ion channel family protein [Sandaracinaceae bacterium LLY-WYZ-13_1]|nr:mechanosensitive ion channel family protein [Sandaracinaceae bacterium LLY-WYZ-13_1]
MDNPAQILQFLRPEGILPALFVVFVTWVLARVLAGAFERAGTRFVEYRLTLHQWKSITRLVLYLAGVAAAVPLMFQLSNEALLALGGALAVAIGISLRDLVASIIAGITILVDKPFQVGDRITYGDTYGEVVEIGLRTVRLVTLDDNVVTIPNSKFLTDVVASGNAGELDMMVQMDFFVGVGEDLRVAKRIVSEALASSRYTYLKKPWTIVVSEVQHHDFVAVRLRAKVYVFDVHYEKAMETDVTERVLNAFRAHAIEGPSVRHRAVA